jgi:hypothetical protein
LQFKIVNEEKVAKLDLLFFTNLRTIRGTIMVSFNKIIKLLIKIKQEKEIENDNVHLYVMDDNV